MRSKSSVSTRQYTSAEQRRERLARFRDSGLSQTDFARQHGLKVCTLRRWLTERPAPAPSRPQSVVLRELPLHQVLSPGWAVELALPDGRVLRLQAHTPAALLEHLLRSLAC